MSGLSADGALARRLIALEETVEEALRSDLGIDAMACVDGDTTRWLVAAASDAQARDALEVAVQLATQLCVVPRIDGREDDVEAVDGAWIVSGRAVHVFARSNVMPPVIVVAVARAEANVALLLATARDLAGMLREGG